MPASVNAPATGAFLHMTMETTWSIWPRSPKEESGLGLHPGEVAA